jgi:hypothetical protein
MRKHFKKNKQFYIGVGTGICVAGFTCLIMREPRAVLRGGTDCPIQEPTDSLRPISFTIGEAAQSTIGILGQKVDIKDTTLNMVSYISANRQGPPSWVVRCKETGEVFTSQRAAALAMELAQDHISNHLNGSRDNVNGYHFERICMAA